MQNKLILGSLLAVAACSERRHVVQPDAPMKQPQQDAPVQPVDKCAGMTPSQLRADLAVGRHATAQT